MAVAAPLSVKDKYDVFLSFRGPDTRAGFADCLFVFLQDVGLRVFMDDEKLHVGECITDRIKKAIYDSKVFLPIFSRGYASSTWCLNEISWMVDCMEEFPGKEMLPVFYDVDVRDVKLKTDLYNKSLIEHEETSGHQTVERWRKALRRIPETKGWNSTDAKRQGKLIKRIVEHICRMLEIKHRILPSHFIGMEDKIQEIMVVLDCQSKDVRIIVIHGMGGIGKTTLASAVFNKICWQFEGYSFLSNVRENSTNNGILNLQNKLLHDVHRFSSYNFLDENDAMNCIQGSLRNKNVLVVLDDVSNEDQVWKLVGMGKCVGLGSRIVITTRNSNCIPNVKEIEKNTMMFDKEKIYIYQMRGLAFENSLQLLCRHAFNEDAPPDGYEQPTHDILTLTRGVPLAIEVIGSQLRGSRVSKWKETFSKLKKVPHKLLYQAILMSSYEMLDDEEKEIFLDIAFFFAGKDKTHAFYYWEACDLFPNASMDRLQSYALVKIDRFNKIWMHDLFKDLGREVDRKQSNGILEKRSRLCNEDAKRLLLKRKGTEHVKALKLDSRHAHDFTPVELSGLSDLKFLEIFGGNFSGDFKDDCLSELRWLSWSHSALIFPGIHFNFNNLVCLSLSDSSINESWAGWDQFKTAGCRLKTLVLQELNLASTPNLSSFVSMERLVIRQTRGPTVQIDSSIGDLKSLKSLKLYGASEGGDLNLPFSICSLTALSELVINRFRFKQLPENIGELKGLKKLQIISFRMGLEKIPDSIGDLEHLSDLCLSLNRITELPESIGKLRNLIRLDVSFNNLRGLPVTIGDLVRLEVLNVSYNSDLGGEFLDGFQELQSLKILDLSGTRNRGLPAWIIELSCLDSLLLDDCHNIEEMNDLPKSLTMLSIPFRFVQEHPTLTNLVKLTLYNSCEGEEIDPQLSTGNIMPLIQHMSRLEDLTIKLPNRMMPGYLYSGLSQLSRLRSLSISCEDPSVLSLPSGLESLTLYFCTSLSRWEWLSNCQSLWRLSLYQCDATEIRLNGLESLNNLTRFSIVGCEVLERIVDMSGLRKLEYLYLLICPKLAEIGGLTRLLGSLHGLDISYCPSIPCLPKPPDTEMPRQLYLNVEQCSRLLLGRESYGGTYEGYFQILNEGKEEEHHSQVELQEEEKEIYLFNIGWRDRKTLEGTHPMMDGPERQAW